MNKYVGLLFGLVAALIAAAAALYGIAFMANLAPISIDIGAEEPWPRRLSWIAFYSACSASSTA